MINSIASRGTLYDITGYMMPGMAVEGLILLTVYSMGGEGISKAFIKEIWKEGGFLAASMIVAVAYVLGHMINSISSALLEKWILKTKFEVASDWYKRISNEHGARIAQIEARSIELFNVEAKDLTVFDILARAAEHLPNAFVSGFSFLSFYGMCRSLALICILAIPSVFVIAYRGCTCTCGSALTCKVALGLVSCTPVLIVAIAFGNQYLRFVKYYADYLASTLLCKGENESVSIEKK